MKTHLLLPVLFLPAFLDAATVVNGDFSDTALSVEMGFSTAIDPQVHLDAGWLGNTNASRLFNVDTATNDGNFGYGPFLYVNDGKDNANASLFNLMTWNDTAPVFSVSVRTDTTAPGGQSGVLTAPTDVSWAVYGFTGTSAQLDTTIDAAGITTPSQNNYDNFSGLTGFTELGTGTLQANTAFDTFENQTFTLANPGTYDFLAISFGGATTSDAVGVAIDNVAIVPEPSMTALLGVLGVGALLRRRRA